ncbi:unnamed protein product [Brachionus calyciflorus]|uniref:Apoptosis-inducing factor 1, mitochondrial n=1 Tax=Brachionus calyciflorus TaxID=104777 RepID=A0A813WJC0_9BILA|nr:unnamed protein product [Brachionus calyciflorus]
MRNIRFVNLIQRLNTLNKNSNAILKQSNLLRLNTKPLEPCTFNQSKRHSSSNSHGSSDFSRTAIVYTLFGATLSGGLLVYFLSPEKKQSTPKKLTQTKVQKVVEPEPEPEPEPEQESEESTQAPVEESAPEVTQEETSSAEPQQEQQTESVQTEEPSQPTETETEAIKLDEEKFLPEVPSHAQYLIVGGGTAAMAAFKAIRAKDPSARVLVVTEEEYKPYMRPPLSKDLWMTDDEQLIEQLRFKQYNGNERSLFFLEDEFYVKPKYLNEQEFGGVAILTGKRVEQIDVQNRTVKLDNNWEIAFDKCLIATGGKPRNLPVFEKSWDNFKNKVTLFRNIEDFKKLYAVAKEGKTIAIVGGGFLGSELACALGHVSKKFGGKVVQVFPESGILRKILPEYLSEWTTARVREEGVNVITNAAISKAQLNDEKVELKLRPTNSDVHLPDWLLADHVVVAVGLEPNVQLADKSGFETDPKYGGYLVNAELQARNNIWVAGDAACFYDIKLGRRRVEHHDHAVVSGRLAGENMTGAGKPYWHQSMFWSDLGPKIGFEAIGLIDSSLQTVGLFAKAEETDTPQAQVQESNETLRSEVQESKLPEVGQTSELKTPKSMDDYGKGVILYLKNDTLVGVLTWNVFKRIPIARQLIQSQEKVSNFAEMAKLFRINATGLEGDSSN